MNYWINKSRELLKKKDGYTLLEMIITIAIISILTGLTALGIHGWLTSSYTMRVNETAKTVFYATQNYILEQKQLGKLETFQREAAAYGGDLDWEQLKLILAKNSDDFDPTEYEEKYAIDTSCFLLMQKGSTASNPLYQIVKETTQDEDILANTFLLEYDKKSGVVRSVFYSEQADSFSYSGSEDNKENVIVRDSLSLQKKRQGYYGVTITGKKPISQIYVEEPRDVVLFNGERLYLQWNDINHQNVEFISNPQYLESLIYDITVYRKQDSGGEKVFSIEGLFVANKNASTTLNQEDDLAVARNGYRLAYQSDTKTYQLVLDDIHHSIFETYVEANKGKLPSNITIFSDVKAEDILFCEVKARLNPVETGLRAESLASLSNYQSSAYGGGDKEQTLSDLTKIDTMGSGKMENGTSLIPFSISTTRHLENVRYGNNVKATSNYIQTADLDWKKAEGRSYLEPFAPIAYQEPFRGTYTSEVKNPSSYYQISNLTIQTTSEQAVGMFSQNMGEIRGLTLRNPIVSGTVCTGIVAGINGGTIENVSIVNGKASASHLLGGITGYSTATSQLNNITAEVLVEGKMPLSAKIIVDGVETFASATKGRYVGGISGLNKGAGKKLTAGKQGSGSVIGTSNVGGIFGCNDTQNDVVIEDITNYNQLIMNDTVATSEETSSFGGLVGYQGTGTLLDGSNYGLLQFNPITGKQAEEILHIGGIAGENRGTLKNCNNYAGDSTDDVISSKVSALQTDCINKIKNNTLPMYLGKYVGGIAGTNYEEGIILNCSNRNSAVLGYTVVGGIAGNNLGKVSFNSSNTTSATISGLIIASDYLAGGVFGYSTGALIEGYTNQANVFAMGMAGGITGFHGSQRSGNEDAILSYLRTMGAVDTPAYYEKLLNPGALLQAGAAKEIQNCNNSGFIYVKNYFSGGICGANFGTINRSNSIKAATTLFKEIYEKGNADCVGGITGYNGNDGQIDGALVYKQTAVVELVADDFVGGIVGLNRGTIQGYLSVEGEIYGKGDCVGGVIGMNTNATAVSESTSNKTDNIKGDFFVGGIMGCNVANTGEKNTVISGVYSEKGKISGSAYVGGILGYNAYIDEGNALSSLFAQNGELKKLKETAFLATPNNEGTEGNQTTVFKGCNNKSSVTAERFVGGIVGYNSSRAKLWIAKCTNNGTISIKDPSRTVQTPEKEIYYYIGGITGRNSKSGVIHNSINDGTVKSPSTYLGGICEVNEGYVQFCATGTTKGSDDTSVVEGTKNSVGGIVGFNASNAHVVSCRADQYAKISGGSRTGGLVGTNAVAGVITSNQNGTEAKDVTAIGEAAVSSGEASRSYCSATVIGGDDTGGIVGSNKGSVEYIKVTEKAKISGHTNVGGFVGNNAKGASLGQGGDIITNLTNYASVYGVHEVGGIVGRHDGAGIKDCINAGNIEAIGDEVGNAGGITGSSIKGVTIENCINYGVVRSNLSFAGGITAINNGTLKDCNNFGTVEGSLIERSIQISENTAKGSAIGGITGCNLLSGNVYNCASRTRKDDPNGAKNNPYWSNSTENKIKGNYIAGGIIGHYARHQGASGEFINTTEFSKTVSITMEPQEVSVGNNVRCKIGGFIGEYTPNPRPEVLEDYIFSGKIVVSAKAGKNQQNIGGIVSWQHSNITFKNCIFAGQIIGEGNNGDTSGNYAGVGGLAGRADGNIVVRANKDGTFASNTKDAKVQGAKRVGGVVGETGGDFKVLLVINDKEVAIEDANIGRQPENYCYFENLAQVKGSKSVGGFYGSANAVSNVALKYLKNSGAIYTSNVNDNTNVGGIIGDTGVSLTMDYCVNTASIGSADETPVTTNVGGLVGSWSNAGRKTISNCAVTEDAIIYAGEKYIGGLVGNLKEADILANCRFGGSIFVNSPNTTTEVQGIGGLVGNANNVSIAEDASSIVAMNNANREIALKGKASSVGGLVGIASDNVTIKNVSNKIAITTNNMANDNLEVRAGGLIGSRTGGTLTINTCNNEGVMVLGGGRSVGGVIGSSYNAGTLSISDTENKAAITASGDVGGIAGSILGGNAKLYANKNEAMIQGRFQTGGILGRSNATVKLEKSQNEGEIRAIKDSANGREVSAIGGCVGMAEGTTTLLELTNKGNISVEESPTNTITSIRNIGGVVGSMNGSNVMLNRGINEGKIVVKAVAGYQHYGIGGISGSLRARASIGKEDSSDVAKRTINKGDITITGGTIVEVGGIAGFEGENSLLQYAQNEGKVLGSTQTTNEVGGIVGKTYGLVYSCRTEPGVEVVGNSSVGGLVGRAYDYICKVTSVGTGIAGKSGYDLSVSNAIVKGNEKVGGIVGWQQEATIYNVYTSKVAEVILLKRGTQVNAAGGLVGYAGTMDGGMSTKGVLANCYSFAKVSGETAGTQPYVGGLVGYRQRVGDSAVTSITDSYVVKVANVEETLPPAETGQTIVQNKWAVGNEPYGNLQNGTSYIFKDERDSQAYENVQNPLETAEKFYWNKNSYDTLCKTLTGITPGNYEDEDAILDIMQHYDGFKLPHPDMSPVTAKEGFNYTFPFRPLAGFYTQYGMKLYLGEIAIGSKAPEGQTLLVEKKYNLSIGDRIAYQYLDLKNGLGGMSISELVGQTITVVTYAEGYALDQVGQFTKRSDEIAVQQFVVMPPLPMPQVKAIEPQTTDSDWFDTIDGKQDMIQLEITNWSEYEQAANLIYPHLAGLDSTKIADNKGDLFDEFLNGLIYFEMTDSFNTKKDAGVTGTILTHKIVAEDQKVNNTDPYYKIVPDAASGTNKAYIVIDYSDKDIFIKNYQQRPWHAFKIKAVQAYSTTLNPLDSAFKYRYLNSTEYTGIDYRLKNRLYKPIQLSQKYTGGTDPNSEAGTPGYQLTWELGGGNAADVKGYRIELQYLEKTNADGSKNKYPFDDAAYQTIPFVREVAGVNNTNIELTKEQLALIFTACGIDITTTPWWAQEEEYKIGFCVTALSKDITASMDSQKSDTYEFALIKQAVPVSDILVTRTDNNLAIAWTDSKFDAVNLLNNQYLVTYEILANGFSVEKATTTVTEVCNLGNIKVKTELVDAPFTVRTTIVKKGTKGVTLDANAVMKEQLIGKKLESPNNIAVAAINTKNNASGEAVLTLRIAWEHNGNTGQTPITEQTCSGYKLELVTTKNGIQEPAIEYSIDGYNTTIQELEIPYTDVSELYINIKSIGIYPKADSSDWASVRQAIIQTKLPKPSITSITVKDREVYPMVPQPSFTRKEYQDVKLVYDVNINSADGQQISISNVGQSKELFKTETATSSGSGLSIALPTETFQIGLAGEKLKVQMSNMSADLLKQLPSAIEEVEFTMPRIRMIAPTVTAVQAKEITKGSDKYTIYTVDADVYGSILTDKADEDTVESIKAEENKVRKGQRYRLLYEGSETKFIPVDETGMPLNDGSEVTSFETADKNEHVKFSLRTAVEITPDELGKYSVEVVNIADTIATNTKFADSAAKKALLDGSLLTKIMILPFLPNNLEPTTEEPTTEEPTTEEPTTEEPTTEEPTTEEPTTEESISKEPTTEASTVHEETSE